MSIPIFFWVRVWVRGLLALLLLDIFLSVCEWTRIYYGWRPNLPDEGDNHLVELAVAGNAKYIVTRNLRDVSRMELNFPSLAVITPEGFLKELRL